MKLTIEKVENGFIINGDEVRRVVCEENEIHDMQQVLFLTMEYFGIWGSKHDPERLIVEIKKQKT